MKSIYTLAIIAALGLVSARADEALSPKAREQRAQSFKGGTEVTQTFEFTRGNKIAVNRSTGMCCKDERNLVREQRDVVYTGKNPLRDSQRIIEIAPVK
jgi:hypothetical protein